MDLQDKKALNHRWHLRDGSATALAMAQNGASGIITGRVETRSASTVEEIRDGPQNIRVNALAPGPS